MRKGIQAGKSLAIVIVILMSSLTAPWPAASEAASFDHVTADELKKMIESGEKGFVVVDVQPAGAYKIGHIKGAINFPWNQDLTSAGKLPKDKLLILYCDCAHEEDSIDTATQLQDKWDYTNIKLLQGGWSGWVQLGYPVEKGK